MKGTISKKEKKHTRLNYKLIISVFIFIIFVFNLIRTPNIIYGSISIFDSDGNINNELTEEQLLRIDNMAKDNSYIRDVDDFSNYEAYKKYVDLRVKYGHADNICLKENNILLDNKVSFLNTRVSVPNVEATKEISIIGLAPTNVTGLSEGSVCSTAIQAFYIGTDYLYTVQRSGKDVYFSRLELTSSRTTAIYRDQMKLTNFGHCQTLQYFEWNGKAYFLMSCKAGDESYTNEDGNPYYWCLQIARVRYEAGATYDFTDFKRLSYINKANRDGTAYGTTKRCDAALSSDKKTLLVWCRNTNNKMQFTRYDMDKINEALDNSSNNYLSCGSENVKEAWLSTYTPESGVVFANAEHTSMQGLELNNANCTFIANGPYNKNKYIIKLGSGWSLLNTIKISNSILQENTLTEIEGLQLREDKVYFGISHKTMKTEGKHYIYSVLKSAF